KEPAALATFLYDEYKKNPEAMSGGPKPGVPLPGKRITPPASDTSKAVYRRKVEQGLRLLLTGKNACAECHSRPDGKELAPPGEEIVPRLPMTLRNGGDQKPNGAPPTVAKPDVPAVWLRHARFDHAAHAKRDINCRQCHADAYFNNDSDLQADYYRPRKG